MMDESTFHRLAASTLKTLEQALSEADDSLDVDLAADILTIEFTDGRTFVINSHTAARQIWMAANLEAWHFDPDPVTARWTDSRGRGDLWDVVARQVSARLGRPVRLSAAARAGE